jgi:hypothetical protein
MRSPTSASPRTSGWRSSRGPNSSGVVLLLAPVPAGLTGWAYAGFAITLGSALVAQLSVGDGPEAWGWAAATGVLWGLSYLSWRRLQDTPKLKDRSPAQTGNVPRHSRRTRHEPFSAHRQGDRR